MKHNPATYRAICKALDFLFKKHGDDAATCINRYMRIRSETRTKQRRVAELESELADLKKVESVSRRKQA